MKAPRGGPRRKAPAARDALPSVPLSHPAWIMAALVATFCVLLSVTFRIYETDFWQHLAVGRAIWTLRSIPTTEIWTWPTYGAPDVNSSWGFEALLWPIWRSGGTVGLFVWRWATTFLVFGLAFATSRRMGARGFTSLVVMVVCSLAYRQRSQVRPETLASVWLALTIWLLESRPGRAARTGPPAEETATRWNPGLGLVPLLWVWGNTHISFPLGFVVLAAHCVDAGRARARSKGTPGRASLLAWVGLAALAMLFVNPFGWRAVAEPFQYVLGQRHEAIFQSVPELRPLDLRFNVRNLLPLVLAGWPLLAAWRLRRAGADPVELVLLASFVPLPFLSQRFLGFTMVAAAPYLARDLDEWVRARRWPDWTARPWSRAGLTAATCLLCGLPEWSRIEPRLGFGVSWSSYPVAACDFIEREGMRGGGFNEFSLGGYMLHRFWPDRSRLPFMDIHQAGTTEDRDAYAFTFSEAQAWRDLDDRHHFDYALLRRIPFPGDHLLEFVDADSSFALVFMDDAAALYARRDGPLRTLSERLGYRELPAGSARIGALGAAALADSSRRGRIVAELKREVASSPFHSVALVQLAGLALATADLRGAEARLKAALAIDPHASRAHERLGWVALASSDARTALREFEAERRLSGRFRRYDLGVGEAWQTLGDLDRARQAYERELQANPGSTEARDSLASLAPNR